jgi:hypothetical protein
MVTCGLADIPPEGALVVCIAFYEVESPILGMMTHPYKSPTPMKLRLCVKVPLDG